LSDEDLTQLEKDEDELGSRLAAGTARRKRVRALGKAACDVTEAAEEEGSKSPRGAQQWSTPDDKRFFPTGKTCDELSPGLYGIRIEHGVGLFYERLPMTTEGLIRFEDSVSDSIVDEIEKFWNREFLFRQYGLSYKRGILLWGPPGSGKTCTCRMIMEKVFERNGVVFPMDVNPEIFKLGLRAFRDIQPKTPIVVLMEDLDAILENQNESEVVNLLDGVDLVDKIAFLATTNYPERLQPRIVNRPSRFDKRVRIGHPKPAARLKYLEHLFENVEDKDAHDLNQWAEDTNNLSLAHVKELFVSVIVLGNSYEEAIVVLKRMKDSVEDRDEDDRPGFQPPSPRDIGGGLGSPDKQATPLMRDDK
jgi:hypothetical protein